jgi:hypothetical protein
LGNTNPTKNWGWTQVLRRGWQFIYLLIMLYAYVKVSWKLLKRNKIILCLLISKTVQHANFFKGLLILTLQILINWKTFKSIILYNTVIIILLSGHFIIEGGEASRYPRFFISILKPADILGFFYIYLKPAGILVFLCFFLSISIEIVDYIFVI